MLRTFSLLISYLCVTALLRAVSATVMPFDVCIPTVKVNGIDIADYPFTALRFNVVFQITDFTTTASVPKDDVNAFCIQAATEAWFSDRNIKASFISTENGAQYTSTTPMGYPTTFNISEQLPWTMTANVVMAGAQELVLTSRFYTDNDGLFENDNFYRGSMSVKYEMQNAAEPLSPFDVEFDPAQVPRVNFTVPKGLSDCTVGYQFYDKFSGKYLDSTLFPDTTELIYGSNKTVTLSPGRPITFYDAFQHCAHGSPTLNKSYEIHFVVKSCMARLNGGVYDIRNVHRMPCPQCCDGSGTIVTNSPTKHPTRNPTPRPSAIEGGTVAGIVAACAVFAVGSVVSVQHFRKKSAQNKTANDEDKVSAFVNFPGSNI